MPGFLKVHANPAVASEAVRRASILRTSGVRTPAAEPGTDARTVVFDRISGPSGADLLTEDFANLLRPVAHLHRTPVPGLALFDPFLRIRPRLAPTTASPLRDVVDEPAPTGIATLHGDLHIGQFIRDPSGTIWIVDLDDLAIGPPEADLANLVAHLTTSTPYRPLTFWADRVQTAWHGLGEDCDPGIFKCYLRFAVVRRHLKLREAGRPDFQSEVTAYLRDNSNFSIR